MTLIRYLLTMCLLAIPAFAQTATLRGQVTDESGAIVPGAKVAESTGLYNQNQLIVNVNSRVNRQFSLTGTYMYNRARSNTDGLGTFPANPYSMTGEYGPAATDMHHRVSLASTATHSSTPDRESQPIQISPVSSRPDM